MYSKINRCCKPIIKDNIIYIGLKDDTLNNGDSYYWVNNKQICEVDVIGKNLTFLRQHLKAGHILKIVGSNNPKDKLPNIPNSFISDFEDILKTNKKAITVKYTYDKFTSKNTITGNIRDNYRPKLINNNIRLTIFNTRTKIY